VATGCSAKEQRASFATLEKPHVGGVPVFKRLFLVLAVLACVATFAGQAQAAVVSNQYIVVSKQEQTGLRLSTTPDPSVGRCSCSTRARSAATRCSFPLPRFRSSRPIAVSASSREIEPQP
jgi:hypothetical protein